ncbi:hypothetical protein Q8A73_008287 [Channa argus]|nr:hypothetical protein Q8A73_008287 [Channa argus]
MDVLHTKDTTLLACCLIGTTEEAGKKWKSSPTIKKYSDPLLKIAKKEDLNQGVEHRCLYHKVERQREGGSKTQEKRGDKERLYAETLQRVELSNTPAPMRIDHPPRRDQY